MGGIRVTSRLHKEGSEDLGWGKEQLEIQMKENTRVELSEYGWSEFDHLSKAERIPRARAGLREGKGRRGTCSFQGMREDGGWAAQMNKDMAWE